MGATHRETTKQADWPTGFQPQLSPAAARYLREHRDQAARVVAEALEEAAANQTPEDDFPRSEPRSSLPGALQALVTEAPLDPNLLNLVQTTERLGITRPTLNTWIDEGKVIAWEIRPRVWVIPPEQILGPKKVVPGIQRVLEVIPQHRLAWEFLTEEMANIDPAGMMRPIDALKDGRIDAVVAAADGWGEDFT